MRRYTALAALAALAAAAPAAQADHVAPSITATLALGKTVKDCSAGGLRYSGKALLRPGSPAMRQIKLFARGAGVRVNRSPDRGMLRELGEIGTWITSRRGGTLRIWATIGGKRTNTLRVRVLPKRC